MKYFDTLNNIRKGKLFIEISLIEYKMININSLFRLEQNC